MWDDFISGQIRRTSRNLFLLGTAVLTILGLLLAVGWRDTYNFVFGPFPGQGSELVRTAVPKRKRLRLVRRIWPLMKSSHMRSPRIRPRGGIWSQCHPTYWPIPRCRNRTTAAR